MIQALSRTLGFFSIGLGAFQFLVPRRFLRMIGIRSQGSPRVALTRFVGARELTAAPGLLASSRPVGWLAARVAGDLMDLALLTRALRARGSRRGRAMAALTAVSVILLVDLGTAIAARSDARRRTRHGGRIVQTVTIGRPAAELYRFWRDLENLPRVMPHLEEVQARGGSASHWVARAPLGTRIEWDAEIVDDRPNELVSWRSVEGSQVRNSGTVRFQPAPAQRGTEVTVEMEYDAPGGPIGSAVALLSGEEPRQQVADALRRFKQVMETGEATMSDATVNGRKIMQRPAQAPPEEQRERRVSVAVGEIGSLS